MTTDITAHMIVKNEDQWVWFAIQSVLPFVDKLLIYDTGSTDHTVEIIQSINSSKIFFEKKGIQTPVSLIELRKEQLQLTTTKWLLILDGDEIWPKSQLEKLISAVSAHPEKQAFVNKTRNSLGDVYHYMPDSAGKYSLAGQIGNLNIRLIKKTSDLNITGEYPLESYSNKEGSINSQLDKLLFVDCWYLHTTYLQRTSRPIKKTSGSLGKNKIWEPGLTMTKEELPEVLFQPYPQYANDPLKRRSFFYELIAWMLLPLIALKRLL